MRYDALITKKVLTVSVMCLLSSQSEGHSGQLTQLLIHSWIQQFCAVC